MKSDFAFPQIITVLKESKSLRYYGLTIWSLIPVEIRYRDSLEEFKSKIRKLKPKDCLCHVSTKYISSVGFLEIFEYYFKCKIVLVSSLILEIDSFGLSMKSASSGVPWFLA